jgi:hypothetical protein
MTVWHPNAPILFSLAVNSAKRITAPPRKGDQRDALVSIVFAAASLEAFLNESVYLAEVSLQRKARELKLGHHADEEPPTVSAFAQVVGEAEESRARTLSKFHLANLVLTGKAYDKGGDLFQNCSDLFEARNLLMHGKSEETFLTIEGEPSVLNPVRIFKRLASKKVLADIPPEQKATHITVVGDTGIVDLILQEEIEKVLLKSPESGVMARWSFVIGTKAAAEWACSSAARMATDLMEKIPISLWKQFMEHNLLKQFSDPFKGCTLTGHDLGVP